MDLIFILAFLIMFASSIVTVINESNKKKKQNDTLNKKLDEIYKRTIVKSKSEKNVNNTKRQEKVKKIGNLEKHYDEAIRDDYKEKADDYFSEKRRKLDEYLSRDIKDRLRDFKENKTIDIAKDSTSQSSVSQYNTEENADYEINNEDNIQFSQTNIAKSIIIKEILDKPLALRRIND